MNFTRDSLSVSPNEGFVPPVALTMETVDWGTGPEVLVESQVGRTRWKTPEGYLFCEGVRIARTGPMLYRPDEVPDITADGNRMVLITRDADVLFSETTLASFQGKPVTMGHPSSFVLPGNYRQHTVGTALNPRQGLGVEADYLLMDLLITDEDAIEAVMKGLVEVSPGYSAPREQVKPGLGRQVAIVGNHVAIVKRGRGGPSCAIQDEEPVMAVKKTRSVWDRLQTAFMAKDETAFKEELEQAKDELEGEKAEDEEPDDKKGETADGAAILSGLKGLTDAIAAINTSLDSIKATLDAMAEEEKAEDEAEEEKKVEDEDPEKDPPKAEDADPEEDKTADSAALQGEYADARAAAEILAPGISLQTFDAAAPAKDTRGRIRDLKVRALQAALADPVRREHVQTVMGGATLTADAIAKMPSDSVVAVFGAASALARAANNQGGGSSRTFPQGKMTTAKMQELIVARRKAG